MVIHEFNDAIAFGEVERIGTLRAYVEPLDNFLDFVLSIWAVPPSDKYDFRNRIPRVPTVP